MSDSIQQLRAICLALPGAHEEITWGHPTFRVRGKIFATCGASPDGPATMSVKCTPDLQAGILAAPGYFRPDYVGGKGWIGIRLDGAVSWDEIAVHVRRGWSLTAPKRLQKG